MNKKPLKLEWEGIGGVGGIFQGQRQKMTVEIIDGGASFRFSDAKHTRQFALESQRIIGQENAKYIERIQKTVCKYFDEGGKPMKQERIYKEILKKMNELKK